MEQSQITHKTISIKTKFLIAVHPTMLIIIIIVLITIELYRYRFLTIIPIPSGTNDSNSRYRLCGQLWHRLWEVN